MNSNITLSSILELKDITAQFASNTAKSYHDLCKNAQLPRTRFEAARLVTIWMQAANALRLREQISVEAHHANSSH